MLSLNWVSWALEDTMGKLLFRPTHGLLAYTVDCSFLGEVVWRHYKFILTPWKYSRKELNNINAKMLLGDPDFFSNEEFFIPFSKNFIFFVIIIVSYCCYVLSLPVWVLFIFSCPTYSSFSDLRHLSCLTIILGRLKQCVVFIQTCFTATICFFSIHTPLEIPLLCSFEKQY